MQVAILIAEEEALAAACKVSWARIFICTGIIILLVAYGTEAILDLRLMVVLEKEVICLLLVLLDKVETV